MKAYINTKGQVTEQPDDHDWRECARKPRYTQRLRHEQKDYDGTADSNDGRGSEIRTDDFDTYPPNSAAYHGVNVSAEQTLDCTQDGLGWC